MSSICIRKHLDSETLHIPELKPLIGKTVEIVVREVAPGTNAKSPYDAFFDLAGKDVVDSEAYKSLRAVSQI